MWVSENKFIFLFHFVASGPPGPLGLHGLDGLKGVKGYIGTRGMRLTHLVWQMCAGRLAWGSWRCFTFNLKNSLWVRTEEVFLSAFFQKQVKKGTRLQVKTLEPPLENVLHHDATTHYDLNPNHIVELSPFWKLSEPVVWGRERIKMLRCRLRGKWNITFYGDVLQWEVKC